MTENAEKLPLASLDITRDRVAALRGTFPDVFREGKIDFDALKQALGEEVDTGPERYGLSWAGKAGAIRNLQQPSIATLVPDREESIDFDTTGNVFIEGENLEVLKLLQQAYYGKIKMIYIDPPYNTGHEFIYPDNYREPLDTYLRYSGQVDGDGLKLSTNTETGGRYHSNWLNMMYPRLFLARNLLREDGVIFVSIDDHEVHNLRLLMNEVFGTENCLGFITVVNNLKGRSDDRFFATSNDYLISFARNPEKCEFEGLPLTAEMTEEYSLVDNSGRYKEIPLKKTGKGWRREDRPNMFYPIYYSTVTSEIALEPLPSSVKLLPMRGGEEGRWRWGKQTFLERKEKDVVIRQVRGGAWNVFTKMRLGEDAEERRLTPKTIWIDPKFNSGKGGVGLSALFGQADLMDNPKPVDLIKEIMTISTSDGDIILDFFAGSATTAHAALEINREDKGNRSFIMVQLPEPTPDDSAAHQLGYTTIADIGKERIRRVGAKLRQESEGQLPLESTPQDLGFKVFKLSTSNFRVWDATSAQTPEQLARQLELHIDHIEPGATQERILYEILFKSGFALTAPVERVTVAGKVCFAVAGGLLLVCLAETVTAEAMRGMIARGPQQIVCLDAAFHGNDQLKTNTVLQMRDAEIVFHTV